MARKLKVMNAQVVSRMLNGGRPLQLLCQKCQKPVCVGERYWNAPPSGRGHYGIYHEGCFVRY